MMEKWQGKKRIVGRVARPTNIMMISGSEYDLPTWVQFISGKRPTVPSSHSKYTPTEDSTYKQLLCFLWMQYSIYVSIMFPIGSTWIYMVYLHVTLPSKSTIHVGKYTIVPWSYGGEWLFMLDILAWDSLSRPRFPPFGVENFPMKKVAPKGKPSQIDVDLWRFTDFGKTTGFPMTFWKK